jgi:hypothetical protein
MIMDVDGDEPLFAKTNEELCQLDADALVVEFQKATLKIRTHKSNSAAAIVAEFGK